MARRGKMSRPLRAIPGNEPPLAHETWVELCSMDGCRYIGYKRCSCGQVVCKKCAPRHRAHMQDRQP